MGKKKHHNSKHQPTKGTSFLEEDAQSSSSNAQPSQQDEFPTLEQFQTNNFARRKITSNWDKYEENIEPCVSEVNLDTRDFSFLLKQSNTDGSRFQLNSEKAWNLQKSIPLQNNSLFSVDLNVLGQGLACIPFHDRIGLNSEQILPCTRDKYCSEAEKCKLLYEAKYCLDPDNKASSNTVEYQNNVIDAEKNENSLIKKTNDILNITEEDDDLEEWLEGVLDS